VSSENFSLIPLTFSTSPSPSVNPLRHVQGRRRKKKKEKRKGGKRKSEGRSAADPLLLLRSFPPLAWEGKKKGGSAK